MKHSRKLAMISLSLGIPLLAFAGEEPATDAHDHSADSARALASPLVHKVRRATARYRDVNVAISEGWVRGTPCVSGPNEGAMGVHFVLPERVGDGLLDASAPEALIYEPLSNGALRLVGVEFIVLANTWTGPNAPALEGHLLNYVNEPNRYGLPAFHELHVWAWRHNPKGHFADWNTLVTCNKQPLD
jgi:hypothetical protein